MIEIHHDQEGTVTGVTYSDDLYEDLWTLPDWIDPESPVRKLENS